MALSNKAFFLLQYLRERLVGNRSAPSFEIMAQAIGLKSKSNIGRYLDELKEANQIDYERGKPRTIVLLEATTRIVRVPIAGSISAGKPIPSLNLLHSDIASEFEYLTFTKDQLPVSNSGTLIALRVDGDSMIDANVQHGDWVILTTQFEKHIGDMLAFELKDDQSLTLKRYFEENDEVLLQPENPRFSTLRKRREQVEAHGKVVLVYRRFDA